MRAGSRLVRHRAGLTVLAFIQLTRVWSQTPVTITVDSRSAGWQIPSDFCGLSFETMALLPDKAGGHLFSPTNMPLVTLFRNLGLKHLRIGGATVDMASVRIPSLLDIDQLFQFARIARLKVIYSLRLLNGNPQQDAALARYIWIRYRDHLDSYALGNEPDWNSYHRRDPAITNFSSYLAQWERVAATVKQLVPDAPLSGPDTGGHDAHNRPDDGPGPAWTLAFAQAEKQTLVAATQHDYVRQNPDGLSPITAIQAMLSPAWQNHSNQALFLSMGRPVLAAGLPYRFTEANEVSGGVPQASNAFASALWALNFLHWWAAHGAAGIDFHNKRWILTDTITPGSTGELVVCPRAYAIKAFNLGAQGQVSNVRIDNPQRLNLTAYAVRRVGEVRLTIINQEYGRAARPAAITFKTKDPGFSDAESIFLQAPNNQVNATKGITLGGASLSNAAAWQAHWLPLDRMTNGECTLSLSPASAVILRLHSRVAQTPRPQDSPGQTSVSRLIERTGMRALEQYTLDYHAPTDPHFQGQLEAIDTRLRARFGMTTEQTAVGILDLESLRLALVHPDREVYAASVAKIGILLAYFQLHPQAATNLDAATRHELGLMIKASSNEMATKFSRQIGLAQIQQVLNSYHFYDADHGGGIWMGKHYGQDGERIGDPLGDNSHAATVRQLLRFYLLLEQGQLVSPAASRTMLEILTSPDIAPDPIKFVKGLAGRDLQIQRKWGSWEDWLHDSAIITGPGRHYILVALTHHPKGDEYLEVLAEAVDDLMSQPGAGRVGGN